MVPRRSRSERAVQRMEQVKQCRVVVAPVHGRRVGPRRFCGHH